MLVKNTWNTPGAAGMLGPMTAEYGLSSCLVDDVQGASDRYARSEVGSGDNETGFLRPVSRHGDLNDVSLRIYDHGHKYRGAG